MVQCAIKFENNPLGTFYSGSIVNGKVEVVLEKPIDVQVIYLKINGEADVRWKESTGSGKDRTTVTYTANDRYIHTKTCLYGSPDGNAMTIDSGSHVYTFSCTLPPEVPSSVEGHYGKIRYSAKVVFARPWKFSKTFTAGITVVKIFDLNYENPQIRLPSTIEIQKQFWFWRWASQPLIIKATVPQTGYVCGQIIPVKINLVNESRKNVKQIGVTLKQLINATSSFPYKKTKLETITIAKVVIESIQNLPKEELCVELLVPPVPATCTETNCRIVQVNYEVRVKASIQGPHINPMIAVPIIIGNVPLNTKENRIKSSETADTNAATLNPTTPEISAADFGLPPPTYEEVMYLEKIDMNDQEEHPISKSSYLPRYPVFNFKPSTPAP